MGRLISTFIVLTITLGTLKPVSANLIVNGGFESGNFDGWNYQATDRFSFVSTGFNHSGDFAAWLGDSQANAGGSITQMIATILGGEYQLSFWFAGNGDNPSAFTALVGGNILFNVINPAFDSEFKQYSYVFTAQSTSTLVEFQFHDDPFYMNLDDISVEVIASSAPAIPEPSSMVSVTIATISLISYKILSKLRHHVQ